MCLKSVRVYQNYDLKSVGGCLATPNIRSLILYDSSNPTLNTKIGEDNQKQESESEFNDRELYYEQSI